MKCRFSRLLYPKTTEEAQSGSYMIAIFRPCETVLDARGEKLDSIKVVGHYLPTVPSVKVDMTGHWKKDPRYGLQFEMESFEEDIRPDKSGIVSYLSSGMIRGIGKKLAERIYATFGEKTLEILDADAERICEVPGIGKKQCAQFCSAYMETRGARKIIAMLAPFDISAGQAVHLRQKLGNDAQWLLTQMPYTVFERGLIDFHTADQLAQANGIPRNAPERLDAALLYTLQLAESEGHLALHKERFIHKTVDLLHTPEVTWKLVAQRAFEMLKADRLALYHDYTYRPIMAQAEADVAMWICEMLRRDKLPYMGDLDDEIDAQQAAMGFTFAQKQRTAVKLALTSPICIISGGPGTGKTSIQQAILNIYHKAFPDKKIVCCAPTGRAARRMEQSTAFDASTVHKAVGLVAGAVSELQPLEHMKADLVLVDEISMLDMVTTWHLFSALPPGCRLILVGDADQLPSVGPGAVLSELLACGKLPVVVLDKVFRQSEGSIVAENAQRIRANDPELAFDGDFQFWASGDVSQSTEWLERLYMSEIGQFGVDNVAMLTPFRKKTETGVHSMNQALHNIANPPSPEKAELELGQRVVRVGDKMMQMKNTDFASNGDIGYVCNVIRDTDGFMVEVDFGDDRIVAYEDAESLRQLDLAYATTIHKSQGGEYDSVLINIQHIHRRMLNRALFYTAITRAKKRVIIVGDWDAVVHAIATTDTEHRNTLLAARINEQMKGD